MVTKFLYGGDHSENFNFKPGKLAMHGYKNLIGAILTKMEISRKALGKLFAGKAGFLN